MANFLKKLDIPLAVFGLVVLAFVLRIAWLKDNLFFGFEQGRDFLKMRDILAGDLVLVGPNTDIPGFFHGALSYYIPLIPFYFFKGNPYLVLVTLIALNSLAIIPLYKLVKVWFNQQTALVACLLYAISYSAIVYARWLSNPNLIPFLTIMYLYFLSLVPKNWKYLLLAAGVYGVMLHLILIVPLTLAIPTLVIFKKLKVSISKTQVVAALAVLALTLSTYFVFEIKNGFIMTTSFLGSRVNSGNFLVANTAFINQFIDEAIDSTFPLSPRFGLLVLAAGLIYGLSLLTGKTRSILLVLVFSVPILFIFISGAPLRHFFVATPVFVALLFASVYVALMQDGKKRAAAVFLGILILGNISTLVIRLPESKNNFLQSAQRTYLGDMEKLIDYVYEDAAGKDFTYDYYSMPYWREEAWVYLFQWYAKSKYGYAPPADRTNVDRTEIFYTFIEPNESAPVHLNNWYGEYKKDSKLLDTYWSGKLRVEKRQQLDETES